MTSFILPIALTGLLFWWGTGFFSAIVTWSTINPVLSKKDVIACLLTGFLGPFAMLYHFGRKEEITSSIALQHISPRASVQSESPLYTETAMALLKQAEQGSPEEYDLVVEEIAAYIARGTR